ncbi:hypothetical protein ACE7GA_02505 [Roseomonas sp. CCTCC AB2023176]|uniref:hypothetical protein n=1 Tax=Roseomonas sp. CCTCC AB2023176 TaxID=3342640 RepID=UPI0035E1FE56
MVRLVLPLALAIGTAACAPFPPGGHRYAAEFRLQQEQLAALAEARRAHATSAGTRRVDPAETRQARAARVQAAAPRGDARTGEPIEMSITAVAIAPPAVLGRPRWTGEGRDEAAAPEQGDHAGATRATPAGATSVF